MGISPRLSSLQVRAIVDGFVRNLRGPRTSGLFAAVNISTLAFAAWTLWIYFSYGQTQQRLSNEQLRLAVTQAELASRLQLARENLSTEKLGIENQLSRLAFEEASEGRVKLVYGLDLERIRTPAGLYEGDFDLEIENISRKRVEVSWVVFEWYIGRLVRTLDDDTALPINAPPKRERNITEAGPLEWQHQGSQGFVYPDSHLVDADYFRSRPYFQKGGGPTKSLAPADVAAYTMPLLVRSRDDRWLGVVAIIGIDGGRTPRNVFWVSRWIPLRAAELASGSDQPE